MNDTATKVFFAFIAIICTLIVCATILAPSNPMAAMMMGVIAFFLGMFMLKIRWE